MKKSILGIIIILVLFLTSCGTKTATITMPDLRGVYIKTANEVLDELNLIPAIYYVESDEEAFDTVLKTVPEAGTELKPYSRIEMYVID